MDAQKKEELKKELDEFQAYLKSDKYDKYASLINYYMDSVDAFVDIHHPYSTELDYIDSEIIGSKKKLAELEPQANSWVFWISRDIIAYKNYIDFLNFRKDNYELLEYHVQMELAKPEVLEELEKKQLVASNEVRVDILFNAFTEYFEKEGRYPLISQIQIRLLDIKSNKENKEAFKTKKPKAKRLKDLFNDPLEIVLVLEKISEFLSDDDKWIGDSPSILLPALYNVLIKRGYINRNNLGGPELASAFNEQFGTSLTSTNFRPYKRNTSGVVNKECLFSLIPQSPSSRKTTL